MKIKLSLVVLSAVICYGGAVIGFEDKQLSVESYWNGWDYSGGFYSGPIWFDNSYTDWGGGWYSWEGFAYSNMTDTTTPGNENQYSAIAGSGANGSENYAVAYCSSWTRSAIVFNTELAVNSIKVTNTTYAYYAMADGDMFSKKFTAEDEDWFLLTITGWDNSGEFVGSVDFYLADFTDPDPENHYILDIWQSIDLSSLGKVRELTFSLSSSDVGDWGMNTPSFFALDDIAIAYAPAAGQSGSTAIHKDDEAFAAWATDAEIVRGPMNISNPSLGLASFGTVENALGKAGDDVYGVVSLGDGGVITLTFNEPIANGLGADFAVFENSFSDTFLELGFVEVSSDGVNFFRFPAVSLTQTDTQVGGFGNLDPTNIYNFAGKYRQGYGTPFDLEELKGIIGLDINNVTHVRIIDVVGCIQEQYATYDYFGNIVNDPWSTPFESSGFDLDAVGVINERPLAGDLNFDGFVDVSDLIYIADSWLAQEGDWAYNSLADMTGSGAVNYEDLAIFAELIRQ